MKNNVKNVVKYKTYDKEVLSFDEKGKMFTKKIRIKDAYQVFLATGASVVVREKDLSRYGIVFKDNAQKTQEKAQIVEDFDDEDDDIDEIEEESEEELPVLPLTTNTTTIGE